MGTETNDRLKRTAIEVEKRSKRKIQRPPSPMDLFREAGADGGALLCGALTERNGRETRSNAWRRRRIAGGEEHHGRMGGGQSCSWLPTPALEHQAGAQPVSLPMASSPFQLFAQ